MPRPIIQRALCIAHPFIPNSGGVPDNMIKYANPMSNTTVTDDMLTTFLAEGKLDDESLDGNVMLAYFRHFVSFKFLSTSIMLYLGLNTIYC